MGNGLTGVAGVGPGLMGSWAGAHQPLGPFPDDGCGDGCGDVVGGSAVVVVVAVVGSRFGDGAERDESVGHEIRGRAFHSLPEFHRSSHYTREFLHRSPHTGAGTWGPSN